jgi:predicted NAD/FAD-binding protein
VSRRGAPAGTSRRSLLRLAAAGAFLASSAGAQARGELRVLLAAETAQHAALIQALRSRWANVTTHTDPTQAVRGRTAPLAYTVVGPRALQQALRVTLDAPLISALVSRQAYLQLVEQAARPARGVTAVFAESSPAQQMRTIAAVIADR